MNKGLLRRARYFPIFFCISSGPALKRSQGLMPQSMLLWTDGLKAVPFGATLLRFV